MVRMARHRRDPPPSGGTHAPVVEPLEQVHGSDRPVIDGGLGDQVLAGREPRQGQKEPQGEEPGPVLRAASVRSHRGSLWRRFCCRGL